jgi:hypothetical protein
MTFERPRPGLERLPTRDRLYLLRGPQGRIVEAVFDSSNERHPDIELAQTLAHYIRSDEPLVLQLAVSDDYEVVFVG